MDEVSLQVFFLDGTNKRVKIQAADIVAFEDKFDLPVDEIRLNKHLYFLAYTSLFRQKETAKNFSDWLLDLEKAEFNDPKGLSV